MRVIRDPRLMQRLALRMKREGKTIAFVPTMGALHAGHQSLLEKARSRAPVVIASIYVNPTQFGPQEDLRYYPRPFAHDTAVCRRAGVDLLFAPKSLYQEDHSTWVQEEVISRGRCAGVRPGHFRGVATIVLKLFQLTQPDLAFFGQKDAQQLDLVRRMVRDLNLPIRIVPVETVRDRDGLALSSRNRHLSDDERMAALALPLLLQAATGKKNPVAWLRQHLVKAPGLRLDYAERVGDRLCAAVFAGRTRLIDNVFFPFIHPS